MISMIRFVATPRVLLNREDRVVFWISQGMYESAWS